MFQTTSGGVALASRVRALRLVAFDFDGVFTDNTVYVSEDGREQVRCWRSDGIGLRRLEAAGVDVAIVSSEVNPVVAARGRKLRVHTIHGCADKLAAVTALARERGASLAEVAFVGNDINDRECMLRVGLPIAVADAYPEVARIAAYVTRAPGGRGAVREVCDLVVAQRQEVAA